MKKRFFIIYDESVGTYDENDLISTDYMLALLNEMKDQYNAHRTLVTANIAIDNKTLNKSENE